MDRRFVFSREASLDVVGSSALPPESSRVLNRQIKAALSLQLRELIPQALMELDGRLRHPEKWPWTVHVTVSLLTHLLLCTCVEQIQLAVDAFVFSKIPSEGADHIYTRQCGRDISLGLEQRTLEHSWILLEGILKGITKKDNPFKAGVDMNDELGLNEAEKNLVNDVRQIGIDHGKIILHRHAKKKK